MRFDLLFESVSVLSSLWGSVLGTCHANPTLRRALYEATWRPAAAGVTAFIDVTVVPMDTERVLPNQTVLVADGRITALGPVNTVQVPAGALRIDGRGKYLMPGLGDMHAHLFFRSRSEEEGARFLASYLAYGITTVRQIDAAPTPWTQQIDWTRYKAPEFLGPRLYLTGWMWEIGPWKGAPMVEDITKWVRGPDLSTLRLDSIAAYLAAFKAAGWDFFGFQSSKYSSNQGYAEVVLDSMLVVSRRLGLPLAEHIHLDFERAVKFGAHGGSLEHLYAFEDLLGRPDVPAAEIQARVAALRRGGAWVTLTLGCYQRQSYSGHARGVAQRAAKALQDAGVKLLLGSDVNGGVGQAASVVPTELTMMVRAGLTPYQALFTGTRNVAQYLGLLDSSGTVAVGKRADLILLQGNPLADIRHVREPVGVMLRDRWLDRAALDRLLLARPWKAWFLREMIGARPGVPMGKVSQWADSLERATPSEYEGVARRLTDELGAIRTDLTPEQRELFDPIARVWLREQARQGFVMGIPGVSPLP